MVPASLLAGGVPLWHGRSPARADARRRGETLDQCRRLRLGAAGAKQPVAAARRSQIVTTWSTVLPSQKTTSGRRLPERTVMIDPGEVEIFVGGAGVARWRPAERDGRQPSASRPELLGLTPPGRPARDTEGRSPLPPRSTPIWKRRWRSSLAPWRPRVYQPRCLRNSTTVLRCRPGRRARRACSSATRKRSRPGTPARRRRRAGAWPSRKIQGLPNAPRPTMTPAQPV
jgi:hypothetical protein